MVFENWRRSHACRHLCPLPTLHLSVYDQQAVSAHQAHTSNLAAYNEVRTHLVAITFLFNYWLVVYQV